MTERNNNKGLLKRVTDWFRPAKNSNDSHAGLTTNPETQIECSRATYYQKAVAKLLLGETLGTSIYEMVDQTLSRAWKNQIPSGKLEMFRSQAGQEYLNRLATKYLYPCQDGFKPLAQYLIETHPKLGSQQWKITIATGNDSTLTVVKNLFKDSRVLDKLVLSELSFSAPPVEVIIDLPNGVRHVCFVVHAPQSSTNLNSDYGCPNGIFMEIDKQHSLITVNSQRVGINNAVSHASTLVHELEHLIQSLVNKSDGDFRYNHWFTVVNRVSKEGAAVCAEHLFYRNLFNLLRTKSPSSNQAMALDTSFDQWWTLTQMGLRNNVYPFYAIGSFIYKWLTIDLDLKRGQVPDSAINWQKVRQFLAIHPEIIVTLMAEKIYNDWTIHHLVSNRAGKASDHQPNKYGTDDFKQWLKDYITKNRVEIQQLFDAMSGVMRGDLNHVLNRLELDEIEGLKTEILLNFLETELIPTYMGKKQTENNLEKLRAFIRSDPDEAQKFIEKIIGWRLPRGELISLIENGVPYPDNWIDLLTELQEFATSV